MDDANRPTITSIDGKPARQRRRRVLVVVAGALLLIAAVVSGMAIYRDDDEDPTTNLMVGWGGSEGHPSCVYDPHGQTVEAKIRIEGEAPSQETVTVTVTAYADENTSKPVGSSSRSVDVEGAVDTLLLVTIPVHKAPKVDVDGETACRLSVKE